MGNFTSQPTPTIQTHPTKTISVCVDPGQEIDDEQLLWYLENLQTKTSFPHHFDLEVVFCGSGKLNDQDSLHTWINTFKFPEPSIVDNWTYIDGVPGDLNVVQVPLYLDNLRGKLTYTTLEEYATRKTNQTDIMLVCASLNGWDGEGLQVNELLLFQGNTQAKTDKQGKIISPPGFNASGSETFIHNMKSKIGEKFVEVSSELCSQMLPTPQFLNCLPEHFSANIAETGFKLMVGRITPGIKTPDGTELSKKIGAGLINPNRGRGANFKACQSLAQYLGIDINVDFSPPRKYGVTTRRGSTSGIFSPPGKLFSKQKFTQCQQLAIRYFAKLYDIPTVNSLLQINDLPTTIPFKEAGNKLTRYDWDRETSIQNLTNIHMFFDYLSPGVWDNRTQPFYSDFTIDTPDQDLQNLRNIYIENISKITPNTHIEFLNPSYDLFLGFLLTNYFENGFQQLQNLLINATPSQVFQTVSI